MPTCSITSACVDGRAQNPRYIQGQLRRLHQALLENAQALQAAASHEGKVTPSEAALEHALAVDIVRRRYEEIDVKSALDDEYRTARGLDWISRTVPKGIVHIKPQRATMLYSVVAPLSSAITAGNCVVVELESSLREITKTIRQVLQSSLDKDTVAVVNTFGDAHVSLEDCITVDQSGAEKEGIRSAPYCSPQQTKSIAVVDRSADIASAARQLTALRTAFNGSSPYAPDLVLVNEFALNDFLRAAAQALTDTLGMTRYDPKGYSKPNKSASKARALEALGKEALSDQDTEVLIEGDRGSLIVMTNRKLLRHNGKMQSPILIVHPIRSLDDGIDLANTMETVLLCSYHFAAPEAAKYTAQFIESHASFINTIPIELRVGPAAPGGFAASAIDRYRPVMFTSPSPLYSQSSELSKQFAVAGNSSSTQEAVVRQMALRPLPQDDRRPGGAVGFFEQGIITGATLLFTPILGGLGIGIYIGARAILSRR